MTGIIFQPGFVNRSFPMQLPRTILTLILGVLNSLALSSLAMADDMKLSTANIRLPPGFKISIFSNQIPYPRSLALGKNGTVFVGSVKSGKVYSATDINNDGSADAISVIAEGLNMPNGVAYDAGNLYIGEIFRILRIRNVDQSQPKPEPPEIVYNKFPSEIHHGWKYLKVGPDHKLYSAVGAPCNVCLSENEIFGTLVRLDTDGKNLEIFAKGVRNSVGFDWHPLTHELWFTDNGRDWLGDDLPPDELNHAPGPGLHFGFPFCHAGTIADPEYGQSESCSNFTPPAWKFPAHVAALGAQFYTAKQFPDEYWGQLFVAQHGSWNRSSPAGYRVVVIKFKDGHPVSEQSFAEGWLGRNGEVKGRPVDILQMPDGAILVSDDKSGTIYRISYQP